MTEVKAPNDKLCKVMYKLINTHNLKRENKFGIKSLETHLYMGSTSRRDQMNKVLIIT